MKPVLCIAGPTASGKSDWAVELAQLVDGEVINADSMQVYGDLQILSARPSGQDMRGIPHHMFGHVSAAQNYSVGEWVREVVPVITEILARGRTPILTGGTGLYFKALTEGLAQVPEPSDEAKRETERLLVSGISCLRAKAEQLDPVATARVLGADPQRLSRIVSVALGTNQPLSHWQKQTRPIIPQGYWKGAVIMPERENLYERINKRYAQMVENGGLDEARSYQKAGHSRKLTASKAIGLSPLLDHLEEKISYEEALNQAKRDTRRLAKRQFTWFRGQTPHWFCVKNSANKEEFRQIISQICV